MLSISNRSIDLLRSDNPKRYKWYVLWERESEFETYFAIGTAFASIVEQYHKLWVRESDRFIKKMREEFNIWLATEEQRKKALVQIHELVENAKLVIIERTDNSEFTAITPLNSEYSLKCKYDALWDDYVEDYKTVKDLTKDEEIDEKYKQQVSLYQWSEYKRTWIKKRGKITEIKKWRPTLPTKKDDLIAMIPEWVSTEGTIADLRARLYLHVTKEQISREHWFEWDDSILDYIDKLLKKAIVKADRLRTIKDIDHVL